MRKWYAAMLAAALLLCGAPSASAEDAPPEISAECAVVMNSGGEIVCERNSDQIHLIASTTKLMTALVVIERCQLDESLEIRAEWCGIEGSSMYLLPGQWCTVRELLLGLLLASANDAAVALACHTAGDVESFAVLMNEQARALGMQNSSFVNPHGLDAEGHYSTARDLALLMNRCMAEPEFAELCTQRSATVGAQTFFNHNKLLSRCPGCIGGKTGYTKAAGRCLVSCAEREGTRFICVTLSDPNDWNDHIRLYDWAFSRYAVRCVVDESVCFDVPVLSGEEQSVTVRPQGTCHLFLPRDAQPQLIAEMPRFAFAPLEEGAAAGRLLVLWEGRELAEIPLVYASGVTATEPSMLTLILEELLS